MFDDSYHKYIISRYCWWNLSTIYKIQRRDEFRLSIFEYGYYNIGKLWKSRTESCFATYACS